MSSKTSVSALAGKPWLWPALLAALAVALVVPGLGSHGFWEPHEIVVAERAQELAAERAEAAPEAAEDGDEPAADEEKGSEPEDGEDGEDAEPSFTVRAVAASIAALGPGERAARLPMAIFGLVALAATALLGWRLASARAGVLAGVALLSFPLFTLSSRLLVGEIASVAAHALIALGAAGLVWPRAPRRGLRRLLYAADGAALAAGIALGHAAAGTLLGVTAPLAGAALAAWLAFSGEARAPSPAAGAPGLRALAAGALVLSAAAACAALWVVADAYDVVPAHPGDRAIFGRTLIPATGDIDALGGAWRESPDRAATFDVFFERLAYGMFPWSVLAPIALVIPALSRGSGRRAWGAYLLLGWAVAAWAAASFLHRAVGPVHFPALAAVAAAVGAFLDDVWRAREGREEPGAPRALPLVAAFALLAALVIAKDMLSFPGQIAGVHLAGDSIEAPDALMPWVAAIGGLGVLVALALALALHGWEPRPGSRLALARAPVRGALPAAVALSIAFGGLLAHGWLPALSGQYSSKGIFDALAAQRDPGDRLVVLGSPGPGHELYARGELESVSSRNELIELFDEPERSFALIRRSRLCPVQQTAAGDDVPYYVVDDGNADFLLLSNQLDDGQKDLNPLSRLIHREPPEDIDHLVDATYDETLRLIGYDMPQRVSQGDTFEMTLYYEVLDHVTRDWKVFVHFDSGQRFNGDHEPAEGVCGTRYWQKGDIIYDSFEVTAGGAGHPRGEYQIWSGFFVGSRGNWTNMEVSDAPEADEHDRVKLGTIHVD